MSSVDPAPRPGRTARPSGISGGDGNGGGGGGRGGGRGNQTSNLYLYTFLATLLLLLTISVIVVGRSIIMRRRARRMIEEAVRNGTWFPQTGRPVVKLGEKPKLFDVYTTLDGVPRRSPPNNGLIPWGGLKPLSATLKQAVYSSPKPPVVRAPAPMEPPPSLLSRLIPQLRPLPRVATPDSPAYPLESRQSPHNTALTVSVMIAMPTPPTVKSHSSFEDTFPPVQFGVAHLPAPRGWIVNAKPESG